MKRKLIQHGLSSLTVSLPRNFVKTNNLKKGEEIEVLENGENLLVSAKKHYEKRKITIDVSESQPMLRKIIGATFKSGYDEIEIKFSSAEELKAVKELVREQFTGFEIISQAKNSLTLKNLAENNFEEFPNVLRRFFLVLNQIAEETPRALEKNDFEWLKSLALLKVESDKFADYCRRAINLGADTRSKRSAPLYTIIEELEKTMDRYAELEIYVSSNKIKASGELISLLKGIFEFETNFYQIFYKFEMEKIVELGKKKQALQKQIEKIAEKSSKKELRIVSIADRILNLIFDLNGPLMALNI